MATVGLEQRAGSSSTTHLLRPRRLESWARAVLPVIQCLTRLDRTYDEEFMPLDLYAANPTSFRTLVILLLVWKDEYPRLPNGHRNSLPKKCAANPFINA
jgi:hypothetical protein